MSIRSILVVGTGALGCYIGSNISLRHSVKYLSRGSRYKYFLNNPLTIKRINGKKNNFKLDVVKSIEGDYYPDVILIAVKSYSVQSVVDVIAKLVSKKTIIISNQNGFQATDILNNNFEPEQICPMVCWFNVAFTKTGILELIFPGDMIIGKEVGVQGNKYDLIKGLFETSLINCIQRPNIELERWKKFIFICAVNGMTAYFKKPLGKILSEDESRFKFIKIMEEVETLSEYYLKERNDFKEHLMHRFDYEIEKEVLDSTYGSMYYDVIGNKPSEIASLNCWVAKESAKLGLSTPMNKLLCKKLSLKSLG